VAILVTAAFYQSALIGWWRGEAKYKGRYTNSWRAEMRTYDQYFRISSDWYFFHTQSRWEHWLSNFLPKSSPSDDRFDPPWKDGDPKAIPLLVELLQAPETCVRVIAASGLETIGPPARDAIPALLAVLRNDNDEDVANEAFSALEEIDREVAAENVWVLRRFVEQAEPP
jgi:hypothetical protein